MVEKYGERDDDAQYENQEYSLLRYPHLHEVEIEDTESAETQEVARQRCTEKVEIEDTTSAEMQEVAQQRLDALFRPLLPTGLLLWTVIVASGVGFGLNSHCSRGAGSTAYVVLALCGIFQVWSIERLTRIASRTTFEERPLVRMMCQLSGLDCYPMQVGWALLDLSGKFTRALFVGQAVHCSKELGVDEKLVAAFRTSALSFLVPIIDRMGLGGLAVASFTSGPLLFQGLCMLHSWKTFYAKRKEVRNPEISMGMSKVMDDYAAVADWAMLNPLAKVFNLAAIPLQLEDDDDVYRMWDRMRTMAITNFSNLLPDNIFQMWLMVRWISYTFKGNIWDDHGQLLGAVRLNFAICTSWATAMYAAWTLLKMNCRLTVMIAFVIFTLGLDPLIRSVTFFVCDSHVFNLSTFHCVSQEALGSGTGLL